MPIWPPLPPGGMPQVSPLVKALSSANESCMFKATISAVAGGGFGLLFGLFTGGYSNAVDKAVELQGSPAAKLRIGFKEAGASMIPYARSFATFGVVFSGSECVIEKVRARHDIYNSVMAGCATGAILAAQPRERIPAKARAYQMAVGCAGMAAFSAAIDYYMEYM